MQSLKIINSHLKEAWYTLYSIAKGHIVTIRNLFRKKVTVQYPEQRLELPEGYRGAPCLPVDPETGIDRCIGCGACARICPTQTITVESHMGEDKKRIVDKFVINIGLCMFCGLCEEVCPVSAIKMSREYELADFSRDSLIYDRKRLNEIGGVQETKDEPQKKEKVSTLAKEGE
ncbi:MAG: NADH-quinone oxidoreductase subunit I [Armatimonadetes bacterium]|nr:NADH-quinone oxidoreductase subunit I [Armatimonadota bacterium]